MSDPIAPLDPLEQAMADERTLLLAFLDDARAETLLSVAGLSDEQARQRRVPSLTSPISVLKHLVFVERNWFHVNIAGSTRAEAGIVEDAADSWVLSDDDTLADLVAAFERSCAEARQIMTEHRLEETIVHRFMGEVSVRFVLHHMIREHSRHAGHVDILREQIEAESTD